MFLPGRQQQVSNDYTAVILRPPSSPSPENSYSTLFGNFTLFGMVSFPKQIVCFPIVRVLFLIEELKLKKKKYMYIIHHPKDSFLIKRRLICRFGT